eukprot:gene32725-49748_t
MGTEVCYTASGYVEEHVWSGIYSLIQSPWDQGDCEYTQDESGNYQQTGCRCDQPEQRTRGCNVSMLVRDAKGNERRLWADDIRAVGGDAQINVTANTDFEAPRLTSLTCGGL